MFDFLTGSPVLGNTWVHAVLIGMAIGIVLGSALNLVASRFESRSDAQDRGDLDAQAPSQAEIIQQTFYKPRDKARKAQEAEAKTG